ncbi:MAG: putative toxin-antitoxin system toxin component, PIN family [Acidobacteriota bacterium]
MAIAVFDTNVCVSALVFARGRGIPTQALQKAVEQDVLVTSRETESELVRILVVKFRWEPDRAAAELTRMFLRSRKVELQHTVKICRDPADNMFLECAERAGADVLVSGDNDLLVLGSYEATRIITAAEYVRGEW